MTTLRSQNAVAAILDEYQKAINELQYAVADLQDSELVMIADADTETEECRSIQNILAHVISSGLSYCVYIQNNRGIAADRPEKKFRLSASDYCKDLDEVLAFTVHTFSSIYDHEIEEINPSGKINVKWGQCYDIEQLMEHAIVHVLRHRRQIANFKKRIRNL